MGDVIDLRKDFEFLRFAATPKGQWFRCQIWSVMDYFDEDTEGFKTMVNASKAACDERGIDSPWDLMQEMVVRTQEIACAAGEVSNAPLDAPEAS